MSNTIDYKSLKPLSEDVQKVMNEELKISLGLAVFYFVFLLAVPILTFTAPELMRTRVWGGMSLTWFMTAIVAMVLATVIAWIHVHMYQKKFLSTVTEYDKNLTKGAHH